MSVMTYRAVPEETLFIDLPDTDGLKMKAILRGSLDMPVVVMVHGLPGGGNKLLPFLGARYLYETGFATLRLFLYSDDAHTRDLVECTLDTHAQDFETAVQYLRKKKVANIFAEGHSYGGATILKSRAQLDGVVLWDPSHGLAFSDSEARKYYKNARIKRIEALNLYLDGMGYIEPKAITAEQEEMGDNSAWAANKGYPLKIISAGKGTMSEYHKKYLAAADEPKKQVVIEEAHHQFEDSDEVMLQLFKETSDWFKETLNG